MVLLGVGVTVKTPCLNAVPPSVAMILATKVGRVILGADSNVFRSRPVFCKSVHRNFYLINACKHRNTFPSRARQQAVLPFGAYCRQKRTSPWTVWTQRPAGPEEIRLYIRSLRR